MFIIYKTRKRLDLLRHYQLLKKGSTLQDLAFILSWLVVIFLILFRKYFIPLLPIFRNFAFCNPCYVNFQKLSTGTVKPFRLTVHTNNVEAPNDVGNRGFCLNYVQQPCTNNLDV